MSLNIGQGIHAHPTLESPRRRRGNGKFIIFGGDILGSPLVSCNSAAKPRNLIEEQLAAAWAAATSTEATTTKAASLETFLDQTCLAPNHDMISTDEASLQVEDIDDRSVLSFLKVLDPTIIQPTTTTTTQQVEPSPLSLRASATSTDDNDNEAAEPSPDDETRPQDNEKHQEKTLQEVVDQEEEEKKEECPSGVEEITVVVTTFNEPMEDDDLSDDGMERSFEPDDGGLPNVIQGSPESAASDHAWAAEETDEKRSKSLDFGGETTSNEEDWNPRPLYFSLGLLAVCNLVAGTWAWTTQSFHPLEVGAGWTILAVALPTLLTTSSNTLATRWSSIFLIFYGIRLLMAVYYYEQSHQSHPFTPQHVTKQENKWFGGLLQHNKNQDKSIARSLHHRRHDHLYHGHVTTVPLSSLVAYELAHLVWLAMVTAPHLWGSTTPLRAKGGDDGPEMLAVLVCLAGMVLQAIISSTAERWTEISLELQSGFGMTERSLLDVGEVLFWLGIVGLNVPSVVQSKRPGVSLFVLSATVVALLWTWALRQQQQQQQQQFHHHFECPHPWAVVEAASQATFLRYNTLLETNLNRTSILLQCMEAVPAS